MLFEFVHHNIGHRHFVQTCQIELVGLQAICFHIVFFEGSKKQLRFGNMTRQEIGLQKLDVKTHERGKQNTSEKIH